ncbi:hypothetical protein HNP65_000727 [Thermosipho japonicus]|uniref:Uncharacterized protein n=1 Tax=Thermosipho japonicus TaxID=90323 RepID=A0A841GJX6_9BACT|nr:hypothetical protein [Thermosipho japonicus]MBB6062305.1 hypothetical protein [Thermosipho japonicus]
MKRIIYLFIFFIVLTFLLWSCGLKIPNELPKNIEVKYTKHVELPITTFKFETKDITNDLFNSMQEQAINVIDGNPVTLQYATNIEFSPKDLLNDFEQQINDFLENFKNSISLSFSADQAFDIVTQSTTLALPNVPSITGEINLDPISFDDLSLLSITIPLSSSQSSVSTDVTFETDKFSSIHLNAGNVILTSTNPDLELGIIISGKEFKNNDSVADLTLENGQTITLVGTYTGSEAYTTANVEVKLVNLKVDKGTGINSVNSKIAITPISLNALDTKEYQIKLSGNILSDFFIDATNLNLEKEIIIKSESQIVASGSPVTFDENKSINSTVPLTIEATLTLSGSSVDLDISKPITYSIVPNASIIEIQNYPINFTQTIELPENLIETKIGTGTVNLEFSGLSDLQVTGSVFDSTITNAITSSGTIAYIDFSGISLPATITLQTISGKITDNQISFAGFLSDDFEIEQAKISNEFLNSSKQNLSFEIPAKVKDFLNSVDATIVINMDYAATNISDLKLNIQSNFFENKEILLSDSGNATISNNVKTLDFNSLSQINISVEATGTPIIRNIKKGKTYGIDLIISVPKFDLDNFNVKSQKLEILPQTTLVDFSTIDASDILSSLELDIDMPLKFLATNTSIDATLILSLSNNTFEIASNGGTVNIGDYIEQLIRNASSITISASLVTSDGILTKDSIFGFDALVSIPLSGTPTKNIELYTSANDDSLDLSDISPLVNIIDSATITFAKWENSTGLEAKASINGKEFLIGKSTPTISLTNAELKELINSPNISVYLPTEKFIQFNSEGLIDIAPYLILDLKVATNVTFEGGM